MSLILNGRLFDAASKIEDQAVTARQHYLECVRGIKEKYGKHGRVKLVRRKPIQKNATGLLKPVPMVIFPAKVHLNAQFASKTAQSDRDKFGGMETWEYSVESPRKKDGDYHASPKSIKIATQDMTLDLNKEMDLIYFLLFKSPQVHYQDAISKYGKRQGGEFMVDDKEERERRVAEGRKAEAKLNYAIYGSQDSPLYDETMLRSVAAAWGIEQATSDLVTEDEVRNLLYANVEAGQKKYEKNGDGKTMDSFLEFIQYDNVIQARALILGAIDRGILKYDMVRYTFIYPSSGAALLVIPEKHKHRKFDYLCDFLLNKTNAVIWEKFRREAVDEAFIATRDFKWVKWLCKEENLPVTSKSEAQLRAALIERYK